MNMVIPSMVLTFVIHFPAMGGDDFVPRVYGDVTCVTLGVVESPRGLIPDAPPRLNWMSQPEYPEPLLQAGTEGHVVLRALVDTDGRVIQSSIVVVQAAHPEFADAVRRAVTKAEFRPGWFAGMPIKTWVTFSAYFDIYVE
ncbi:MAG: energy transducer TonB [Gemmatimonadales bacterium]